MTKEKEIHKPFFPPNFQINTKEAFNNYYNV